MLHNVRAMSFGEYSYESEFVSYEFGFISSTIDRQKQTMCRCGVSLNDNCIFTRCLSSYFGRQRFFVACSTERQQENERSNNRYRANRCQHQGTPKSGRHQGQGCGRHARRIHAGGSQMAGRDCTSYHRQPCDSRRDARYENR